MPSIPSSSVTHPTTSTWKISSGFSLITNDGRGLQLLHDVLQRLHGRMLMGEPLLLMGQVVSSLKTRRGGREKNISKTAGIFMREIIFVDPVQLLQKKDTF